MKTKIVQFLKQAEGYLSGEEISRNLKISRAGIWKYMQELRKDGYDIAAVPHLGYRLVSSPDRLLPSEIRSGLKTSLIGNDIQYFDSVTSTMDIAFRLGMEGAPEGTVVCAESQTKGKGRLGRSWNSPKGKGIYMSILLRPALAPSEVAKLTLLTAVATCEALKSVGEVPATIKWPNDILVGEKKLAGILTEMSAEIDRVRFVVIGIGINVNTPLNLLPDNATSLRHAGGRKFSRADLMRAVLESMERWYQDLNSRGFDATIGRWKQLSSTLGQKIRVTDENGNIEGKAVDLDEHGGLVIRVRDGVTVKRMTGDVEPVK